MRLKLAIFTLVLTSLTLSSFAKADDCEQLAREVVAVALKQKSRSEIKLESIENLKLENVETASTENVERLSFSFGDGASIVVDALPSYYSAGICEVRSLKIGRE